MKRPPGVGARSVRSLAARLIIGIGWLALAALATLASVASNASAASAEDQNAQPPSTVIKTKSGLNFNVPADWPIEKRNGVVGPIPIEEYLGRKFSALENRLQSAERQASAMDLRLRVLEETLQKASRRLQSSEAAPAHPPATQETSNAAAPPSATP